jgi:hypothetical protein
VSASVAAGPARRDRSRPDPNPQVRPRATPGRADTQGLGRLAAEFPEVAFWTSVREQTAVHARLRDVTTGLTALGEMLNAIAVGRAPDERRASFARANAAALDRPVAATGDVPAGLPLPALGEAFVPRSYRTAEVTGRPDMTAAPMLIPGQPGSGKPVLARCTRPLTCKNRSSRRSIKPARIFRSPNATDPWTLTNHA